MAFNPNAMVFIPGKGLVPASEAEPAPKPDPTPAPEPAAPAAEEKEVAPTSWEDASEQKGEDKADAELADAMTHAGIFTETGKDEVGNDDDDDDDDDVEAPKEEVPVSKLDIGDDEEDDEEQLNLKASGRLRRHVNIVFIGHVDAGKSTISGHMMYLTGMIDERTLQSYQQKAKALSRESWVFAWALDTTDQERAKGKTEECGRATFESCNKRFTILDAPGHKSFIPHMIGGASQADLGVLVISARKGEFETGFDRGGQTREHAMLAKTSGVKQLIIVINKMDDPTVEWSEARYKECVSGLKPYLKQCGYNVKTDVTFLPVSGLQGYNLKECIDPSIAPWYKGPSLLQVLDELSPPERLFDVPLRLPIIEKFKDRGTVVMGKLESGTVSVNDNLMVMPNKIPVKVLSLHIDAFEVDQGLPGDNLKIKISGVEEEELKCGFVLSDAENLVHSVKKFEARLIVLEHKSIICAGYSAILHIHSIIEECVIEELLAVIDKKTGEVIKKKPKFVKPGMTVMCKFRMEQPICIEPFKDFPQLGRFMLRDEGKTVGVGVVTKLRGIRKKGETGGD